MKTKYFKKVNFWARELKVPLFWLIDPNHKILRDKTLIFYKNNIIHSYCLDDKEIEASKKGYKFFINKNNVRKYEKEIEIVRDSLKSIKNYFKKIKIGKLTDKELKKHFFKLLGVLNSYSNVYTKTEPFILSKIEAEKKKNKALIKKLGKLRFILRKEGEPIFYILLGVLLKEISKRFKLKVSDLFFYQYKELNGLFSGRKVKNEIIEERKKGYALIRAKDKNILLTGKKFNELYKDVVVLRSKINELTGQTAMSGKVKGKACVILHNKRNISKEVEKFKKGNILVTEMTRPDTILACRKAAAIITDEGGITSHAAIIAREFKIPCVIGTKIATQVLKDGDLIEVDASKGIVKIIK